jgi:hypothetical protein
LRSVKVHTPAASRTGVCSTFFVTWPYIPGFNLKATVPVTTGEPDGLFTSTLIRTGLSVLVAETLVINIVVASWIGK